MRCTVIRVLQHSLPGSWFLRTYLSELVFGMHSWYLRKQESVLTCKFLLFCVLTKHQDDKSEGAWFGFSSSALFVGNPQFQGAELRAFALDLNSCSSSNSVRCWVSEQSLGKECSGCPVKWGRQTLRFHWVCFKGSSKLWIISRLWILSRLVI